MKISVLIIIMAVSINLKGQVIDFYERLLDCGTAFTTLEIGYCSRYTLECTERKMDSLIQFHKNHLDSLIKEYDLLREKDSTFLLAGMTDYRLIKKMFVESISKFKECAILEMKIVGEFTGRGRERFIRENLSLTDSYEKKIEQLMCRINY